MNFIFLKIVSCFVLKLSFTLLSADTPGAPSTGRPGRRGRGRLSKYFSQFSASILQVFQNTRNFHVKILLCCSQSADT